MLRSSTPRRSTARRPELPASPILDEIVSTNFDQRFAACAAVTAAVWGQGYNTCRTPVERAMWIDAYVKHLTGLLAAQSRTDHSDLVG